MSTMKEKHTFVICAYKESAYLEECVKSLKEQKKESNIIMVTSTPNDYIKNICEKYDVELKGCLRITIGTSVETLLAYECMKEYDSGRIAKTGKAKGAQVRG